MFAQQLFRRGPRSSVRKGVAVALSLALVAACVSGSELVALVPTAADAGSPVAAPEHPEGTSFNPNEIKDIKAADPGSRVNLVAPPTPNNTGDARLSYPFEVPKGRGGLQPQLAINYSSSGGSGWTGFGWDVAVPTITLDTRWGVPRYHVGLETESYLLNGEQLTPVAHRGELQARTAEKVFHTRVEGRFDRIVRHGDSPKNYWWEVTDRAGTRSTYGGASDATLIDQAGNIATWALRETRDTHDNFMRYQHVRVTDGGVANSTVTGSNLYPVKITWTGSGSTDGKYSVTFVRDRERGEARRPDVPIDARLGFKKVTADLLRRVEVKLDNQLVRAYELNYRTGAFSKTLLASVSQFSETNQLFNTHTFDYFDDIRDQAGTYNAFATAAGWNVADDDLGVNIREGEASAVSANTSAGVGGHLYVGYNPGLPTKQGSIGVKVGGNVGLSDGLLALADVNGDSLPDKVFRKNGSVYYRPNLSGPTGQPKFGDTAIRLSGLPGISSEKSLSGTIGIEGYAGVAAQLDFVSTTTISDRYLADVNGDGITDLVNNGGVLFGYLDANGQPAYSANSALTPVPVGAGAVSGQIVGDQTAEFDRQVDNSPLLDGVRRWIAPYDGTVRVDGRVKLVQDTSPERAAYDKADGVRVTIQHKDTELWAQRIGPNDHLEFGPTGVGSIVVRKGEAIYFRTQSVLDGKYDTVEWDPKITYTGIAAGTDVNGLDNTVFTASRDFTMAGRTSQVTAPLSGKLQLTGDVVKDRTSDDVTVVITHDTTEYDAEGNAVPVTREVFKKVLPAASTGTTAVNLNIAVGARERLSWKLKVDSPIDATAIRWVPQAHYTQAYGVDGVVDDAGKPTIVINPPYELTMYPVSTLTAPQASYTATQTGTLTVEPNLSFRFNTDSRQIAFTVKKRGGQVIAKRIIGLTFGVGVPASLTRVSAAVTAGDELFFDFSTVDARVPGQLISATARASYNGGSTWVGVPSALHASGDQGGAFAQPHRGWGAIGYQANRDRATRPITQSELVLDQSYRNSLPAGQPKESDVPGFRANPRITAPRIAVFAPLPAKNRWAGSDDSTWVADTGAGSSRMGVDTIDVLADSDIAGEKGVPRRGRSTQISGTLAAGPFGGTGVIGTTAGEVDFLDLNGDHFPDVVGAREIQYSDMIGGLGNTRGSLNGPVRESDSLAGNVSYSAGSPAGTRPTGRGTDTPSGAGNANTALTGSLMPSLGIGGNLGGGESDTRMDLIDINGDGLPDKVYVNGDVALNLGYSFAAREPWPGGPVNDAQTRNVGVNLGFNLDSYGFAGGVSATLSSSKTNATLADVNGDGLADRVFTDGANPVKVAINTGNGFTARVPFKGSFADIAADKNATLGGGVYFTFGFPLGVIPGSIVFNPGVDASIGIGRSEIALRDVDGDGVADHVKSTRDNELLVAVNKTGRTNLLKTVSRPLGAKIDLDYTRTGNTYSQPESTWAMSRTTVHDGRPGDGADTQVSTYRYENGRFDRLEREFTGFGRVVTEQRDPGAGNAVHRSVTTEYRTDSHYTRGLLARTVTTDSGGRVFAETMNTYQHRDVGSGGAASLAGATAPVHTLLSRVDKKFHEGAATAAKSTYVEMSYDEYGNLTRSFDVGDVGVADDVEATFGYSATDSACRARNIVGAATMVRERGTAPSTLLRHRQASVDCATGEVRQIRALLGDNGSDAAVTDLVYFPDGNLRSVTGPENKTGQRDTLEYGYDTVVGVHVESIVDSFGLRSTSTHNLKYGLVDRSVDQNNQQVLRSYDSVGRLATVTAPQEIGQARPTIQFEYHPEAPVPYATSKHLDRSAAGVRDDTIDTVTFVDGLQRVLQVKKDASVANAPGDTPQQVMVVSGRATFDFLGRGVEAYHPITEPKGAANTTFNTGVDTVAPTRTSFDVLDRPVRVVLPDGTATTTAFGFGPDRAGVSRFETVVTDPNGKERRTYSDTGNHITSVTMFNPAGGQPVIWTSYGYDPAGRLTTAVDDKNNTTRSEYDLFGRRTVLDSPDAGRTETRFDLADNITAKITSVLRAGTKAIEYDHDRTRLTAVRYPNFPANNVTYTYGAPGAADNTAGRISTVRDAAGTLTKAYGQLGEVTRETRTIAVPNQAARAFTTSWAYDSFNRVLRLTYPDSEVLTYDYDSGGEVSQAVGAKNGNSYTYLARLDYDKFGQKLQQVAGNGVRTVYTYDPADRQLAKLKSTLPNGTAFQDLTYTRDNVGNITTLTNTAPAGGAIGGRSTQTYGYDDLYQLTSATGEFTGADAKPNTYSVAVAYDSIHNTTAKTQHHEIRPATAGTSAGGSAAPVRSGTSLLGPIEPVEDPTNAAEVQDKTTYDYGYAYGSGKPHAPSQVGPITQAYDANGNVIATTNTAAPGKHRQFVWDEENRLACNQDTSTTPVDQTQAGCADATVRYLYDAKGERVAKQGDGTHLYPSGNYSERDGTGFKHVFVGDSRVATKAVADGFEDQQSFFHADHLGSSSYVTDRAGNLSEHLEYFPFGETWVQEKAGSSSADPVPYKYTGKELDEETGLYYHGARYYNPRTQLWASPDPALSEYLDSDAAGGIHEPRNLASYTYTHNNPVQYTDPTGKLLALAPLAPAAPVLVTPPGLAVGAVIVGTIVIAGVLYGIWNSEGGGTGTQPGKYADPPVAYPPDTNTTPPAPTTAAPTVPAPRPPPAPGPNGTQQKTDEEETVTIYKAPQPGAGGKFMSRGFLQEDFPDDNGMNGMAYFAGPNDRRIAEEYAQSYKEGIIEIRIPKSDYDLIWKRFEKPYEGGPAVELEIPRETVTALNAYRPWVLAPW